MIYAAENRAVEIISAAEKNASAENAVASDFEKEKISVSKHATDTTAIAPLCQMEKSSVCPKTGDEPNAEIAVSSHLALLAPNLELVGALALERQLSPSLHPGCKAAPAFTLDSHRRSCRSHLADSLGDTEMTPALAIYDPSPIAQLDIAPTLILPEDYFAALKDQIAEAFLLAEMAFEAAREAGEPTVYEDAAEKFLCECRVAQPVLRAILTDHAEALALWDIVMAGASFGMAPAHVDLDEYGQPIVWHKGDGWATPVPSPLLAQMNARRPVDQDGNPVSIDGPCIVIPHGFWDTLRETIRTDPNATEQRQRLYQPEKGPLAVWNLNCPKRNLFYTLTHFVRGEQKLSARAALSLAEHYNLRFDLVTCGPNGARTQMLGAEKPKAYPPLRLVETEAEDMDLNEQQFEAMLDLGSDVKAVERGVEQMVVALREMSGPAGAHLSEDEKRTIMQLAADCGERMLADELPKVVAVSGMIDRKLEEIAKAKHRSGFTLVD